MARRRGTDSRGASFSASKVQDVWERGPNYNPQRPEFQKDACGTLIQRSEHGKRGAKGWEVDHVHPVDLGGGDGLKNLQPLYWKNNQDKGNEHPNTWKRRMGIEN